MAKNILFISHEASASGAPMALLYLLRWFKRHTDISFRLLLKKSGGPLESAFAALTPSLAYGGGFGSGKTLVTRVMYQAGLRATSERLRLRNLRKLLGGREIDLVYSNTADNGEVLEYLSYLGCPVITHVHELEWSLRYYVGLPNLQKVRKYTHHYIAASEAVRTNLIQNHRIPGDKIDLVHEFISVDPSHSSGLPDERRRVREQLGIPPDGLVVCASGFTEWRKGPDLFVQLARMVRKRLPGRKTYFLWIGGENTGPTFGMLWHDVVRAGAEKQVHFLAEVTNPLVYFAASDVFALVSREDPYPLVMLEAASVGKPIVCFADAGGSVEFVEDDCGKVVPYLDLEAMADEVVSLLQDEGLRRRLGGRGAQKVAARHSVDNVAPQVLAIVDRFLGRGRGSANGSGLPLTRTAAMH